MARTMTSVLEGVVSEGTGIWAALADRPVAGKTGTTEMPGTGGKGIKDNWFVGYTPQLVGAVWLGYDHTDSSHYLTTTSKAAAAVFQKLMSEALRGEPVLSFPNAAGSPKKKHAKPPKKEQDKDKHGESKQKHEKKDKHPKHGKSEGKGKKVDN